MDVAVHDLARPLDALLRPATFPPALELDRRDGGNRHTHRHILGQRLHTCHPRHREVNVLQLRGCAELLEQRRHLLAFERPAPVVVVLHKQRFELLGSADFATPHLLQLGGGRVLGRRFRCRLCLRCLSLVRADFAQMHRQAISRKHLGPRPSVRRKAQQAASRLSDHLLLHGRLQDQGLLAGLLVFRLLLLVEQCHERHLLVLKLRDVERQLEEKRQPHLRLHRRLVGFDPHSQLQRRRRLPPPLHRRHVQRHKGRFGRQLRDL